MTPSQKFLAKLGLKDPEPIVETQANTNPYCETVAENPPPSFLKKYALGGIALGAS